MLLHSARLSWGSAAVSHFKHLVRRWTSSCGQGPGSNLRKIRRSVQRCGVFKQKWGLSLDCCNTSPYIYGRLGPQRQPGTYLWFRLGYGSLRKFPTLMETVIDSQLPDTLTVLSSCPHAATLKRPGPKGSRPWLFVVCQAPRWVRWSLSAAMAARQSRREPLTPQHARAHLVRWWGRNMQVCLEA